MEKEMNNIEQQNVVQEEEKQIYKFSSSRGAIKGFIATDTTHVVTMKKEDMDIFTLPKRCNNIPNIRYADINHIDVVTKMSWYYLTLAILLCYTVIMPLLAIWVGRNRIITITLNNGLQTKLYTNSASKATEFMNALQAKIAQAKATSN